MYTGNTACFTLTDVFSAPLLLKHAGLCVLRPATAHQQADLGIVYGEPRVVHEEEKAGHHRGAADEGAGPGGEAPQTDGEVLQRNAHHHVAILFLRS